MFITLSEHELRSQLKKGRPVWGALFKGIYYTLS